jgi:hypothetical protein
MPKRLVMMLLFLSDYGGDCQHGGRVMALEYGNLVLQVPEHDALDGSSSSSDSAGPKKAGCGPEYETADTTEPVAAAATAATAFQLSAKDGAVPLLV